MTSAKVTKTYNRIIKTVIVVAALVFLYHQFFIKNTIDDLSYSLSVLIHEDKFLIHLILVVLLMPLNWLLEALKWKQVVAAKEKISLPIALKAVFAGATISSISINRTGEFLGRIFVLKKHSFWEGAIVTIVGSYAQTFNTFLWGILSLLLLSLPFADFLNPINAAIFYGVFLLLLMALLIILFFYYKISWLNKLVKPKFKKIRHTVEVLQLIDNYTLNKVLILSSLRYFVFSFQFYILMRGASIDLPFLIAMMLIAIMYLFNTIRPTIALVEVGLRSASAIYVFEMYYRYVLNSDAFPQVEIAAVTSLIWLINIVLPSIIGMAFIKDLRFFRRENKDKI